MNSSNRGLSAGRSNRVAKAIVDSEIRNFANRLSCNGRARKSFLRIVAQVRSRSSLLKPSTLNGPRVVARVEGVLHVCANMSLAWSRWVREPECWSCRVDSPMRQIRSLIDHVLANSEIPPFMYLVWFSEENGALQHDQRIFLHLARGHSMRGTEIGESLTREMANRFLLAPHHATIQEAIRFATTGRWPPARNAFPAGTSRRRRKTHPQKPSVARCFWQPVAINGFRRAEDMVHPVFGQRTWTIRQLTSRRALEQEGNRMQHCVGVYWDECSAGETSMWSLESHDRLRTRPILTIEVDPRNMELIQAKGFANRNPRGHEMEIVNAWAMSESLRVSLS